MPRGPKAILKQLFVPNGLLALAALVALWLLPAADTYRELILPVSAVVIGAALLLAVRFRSLRAFLILLALGANVVALLLRHGDAASAYAAMTFLTLNLVLCVLAEESFFDWKAIGWWAGLLVVEWIVLVSAAMMGRPYLLKAVFWRADLWIVQMAVLEMVLALGAMFLLMQYLLRPNAASSGLLWTLLLQTGFLLNREHAVFLSAMAAVIIAISVLERSHAIAYVDELTGIPGRRAFNEALAALDDNYCIAMVDVDHFKKFNDTYGHDTGDQVLGKVARHLTRVRGGGKAYRYGGEEFAILFHETGVQEAADYLDDLRDDIASDEFVVRGPDRRHGARDDERRASSRGRHRKAEKTSVTVSIGLASARGEADPEEVVKLADQTLYAAKAAGRNRVEVAQQGRRRPVLAAEASAH